MRRVLRELAFGLVLVVGGTVGAVVLIVLIGAFVPLPAQAP